jgi:hypothetical protein
VPDPTQAVAALIAWLLVVVPTVAWLALVGPLVLAVILRDQRVIPCGPDSRLCQQGRPHVQAYAMQGLLPGTVVSLSKTYSVSPDESVNTPFTTFGCAKTTREADAKASPAIDALTNFASCTAGFHNDECANAKLAASSCIDSGQRRACRRLPGKRWRTSAVVCDLSIARRSPSAMQREESVAIARFLAAQFHES